MILFMLALSALLCFLNGFVSGLVFGKASLFVPHERKELSTYGIMECLALDATVYLISSLKSDFYICIQAHKKTPLS